MCSVLGQKCMYMKTSDYSCMAYRYGLKVEEEGDYKMNTLSV